LHAHKSVEFLSKYGEGRKIQQENAYVLGYLGRLFGRKKGFLGDSGRSLKGWKGFGGGTVEESSKQRPEILEAEELWGKPRHERVDPEKR